MALRRASLSLLKAVQVQNVGNGFRPVAACMQFTTSAPRGDSAALTEGRSAHDRHAYGRSFAQQLHSESQAKKDDHETFHYESSKMTAEGGGAEEKSFQEKSADVLKTKADKLSGTDVKEKTEEATDAVKEEASKGADTAKDAAGQVSETSKDAAGQVSETATELKEVGVEAGKAVARDVGKVAEKVGLTSDSGAVSQTATDLKEVGQEAGKAAVRDANKLAQKVGLKSES